MNKYAGSWMSAMHIYIYDGATLLEDLTTASTGYIASVGYYPSGKVLNIKIDTGDSEIWGTITVPEHSATMDIVARSVANDYMLAVDSRSPFYYV